MKGRDLRVSSIFFVATKIFSTVCDKFKLLRVWETRKTTGDRQKIRERKNEQKLLIKTAFESISECFFPAISLLLRSQSAA